MLNTYCISATLCYSLAFLIQRSPFVLQVCMFEAMKAGQEYLRRAGISVLTTPGGIPLALEQIAKEVDAQTRELADYIHRELQLTPWNLTASFLTGMEGRGQMELSGLADPSGRGQGFSYLRLPARKEEDELGKKKKALLKEKEGKLTGECGTFGARSFFSIAVRLFPYSKILSA